MIKLITVNGNFFLEHLLNEKELHMTSYDRKKYDLLKKILFY